MIKCICLFLLFFFLFHVVSGNYLKLYRALFHFSYLQTQAICRMQIHTIVLLMADVSGWQLYLRMKIDLISEVHKYLLEFYLGHSKV